MDSDNPREAAARGGMISLLSTVIATVVFLVMIGPILNGFNIWGNASDMEMIPGLSLSIYVSTLVGAGWGYVISNRRYLGIIHGTLMLGAAVACTAYSLSLILGGSIGVGRGSDANLAAGVMLIFGLGCVLASFPFWFCGFKVIKDARRFGTSRNPKRSHPDNG